MAPKAKTQATAASEARPAGKATAKVSEMPEKYSVDYKRFEDVADPDPLNVADVDYMEPDEAMSKAYESEMIKEAPIDKLRDMKIKLAMDAYERRRPKDKQMHHYVVKDAGDTDAIGDYFATGDERNHCPIYKNQHGITLTREKQPSGKEGEEESYGWILGNIMDRRPLYGVMTDDLSVPTLNWQGFTAPEPVPTVRYYSSATASRMFKDKGNVAVHAKEMVAAHDWYTKALSTGMSIEEFPEPFAMILSNRAHVALALSRYHEAHEDANNALKILSQVHQVDDATVTLKQKTHVRKARALAGMQQFHEAESVMKDARLLFPDSEGIEKVLKEMQLARSSDAKEVSHSGPNGSLLRYVGKHSQDLQGMIQHFADNLADAVLPTHLTPTLLKLEYVFSKADGEALSDIQTLFRANGGLRALLRIVKVQWKTNLDGRIIDMHKLDSLCTVLSIISLACDGCTESITMSASEAPAFFAALGGCNRKLSDTICTRLLKLVSQVWGTCHFVSKEAVQPCSIVVERTAAFLSKLMLREFSEGPVEVGCSDAPLVSKADKDKAFDLLSDLSSQGGRIEQRAIRGAAPMLASFDGTGFLTSDEKQYRDIGQLFLEKVIKEPSILSAIDVTNLLFGVQLLIMYGPGSGSNVASITLDGLGSVGTSARYVDLESWASTEDGIYASAMLEAVANALEYRLHKNSHELGKEDYEAAFAAGYGWAVCIPLVQAPEVFAKPAMMCMSTIPSLPSCASPAFGAVLGFPTPEDAPAATQLKDGLASSPALRRCAAQLLKKCVTCDGFLQFLRKDGQKSMNALVKLTMTISLDGKSSLEAQHDMLYTLFQISQSTEFTSLNHASADLMAMLVYTSSSPVGDDAPTFYAKAILSKLKLNHKCSKVIDELHDGGADIEDVLKGIAGGSRRSATDLEGKLYGR